MLVCLVMVATFATSPLKASASTATAGQNEQLIQLLMQMITILQAQLAILKNEDEVDYKNNVAFTATKTFNDGLYLYFNTPGNTIDTSYYVDFGDGHKSDLYSSDIDCVERFCVSHSYEQPGNYIAKLYTGMIDEKDGNKVIGKSFFQAQLTVLAEQK